MMGNRKQPFGYKMEFGTIVPQPQEADAVRQIYTHYLAGASFSALAEELQEQGIPYDGDKPWNKNMMARILENSRYVGTDRFPALITQEQFNAVQERRKEMRPEIQQTDGEKELRKLCGSVPPKSVQYKILQMLNAMVKDPQLIQHKPESKPTAVWYGPSTVRSAPYGAAPAAWTTARNTATARPRWTRSHFSRQS